MKKIAIIAMSAFLLAVAEPAIAQDSTEKDVCQISAITCLNQAEILQKRIKKLNAQIAKGSNKYSAEDLKMLEQKLQEAMIQLDRVEAESVKKLDKGEGK
jgi:hypothetical protein